MNKAIKNVIAFSLKNRLFIMLCTLVLIIWGAISFKNIPVEAFPDVTNTEITIISQWPGRSAEEIEKFVSIPIEIAMNPAQRKETVRSTTLFGLSVVKVTFNDGVEDPFARQQVTNLLKNVDLPEGVIPEIQPPTSPTGEIFRYTLKSQTKTPSELKTIQDWVIERQLLGVPGVGDIVSFGGEVKTYEIEIDPQKLSSLDITPLDVYEAVSKSNINVGGDVIIDNSQAYVVRGIGLLNDVKEVENIIIEDKNGLPVLVKNIGNVHITHLPRLGVVGRDDQDNVVQGIVVMRKGQNPSVVIDAVKEKIEHLNQKVLPDDVQIETFYNRESLITYATHTVLGNMTEGMLFVMFIVLIFMADWRTTLIVAVIIPLSLLFAFICLTLRGMSANLLSMGAIDFGIIIDGAVVMVEGIFVVLDKRSKRLGMERFNKISKLGIIKTTGAELGKAIFFSKLIIIAALLPIFSFQKVEGKMFSPLAYTLGFALLGALILTLTLVPLLIRLLLNKNVREKRNRFADFLTNGTMKLFNRAYSFKKTVMALSIGLVAAGFASFAFLGTEFLPQLDEGDIYVRATAPLSISLDESKKIADEMRVRLKNYPEVKQVLSQTGRPNDGTDATGFYNIELHVNIHPQKTWKRKISKEQLIREMNEDLSRYPGLELNFSQPIMDNVEEAVSGVKGSLSVKIFGDDLVYAEQKANEIYDVMNPIEGVEDLGIIRNLGQPELRIDLDQNKMALYGVTTADANAVIEMAIGGKAVTEIYEGEKKFQLRIRYEEKYRNNLEAIGNILIPTIRGSFVPVKEVAKMETLTGPSLIFRDNNERFTAVKFSVRGRDMGSVVKEAQHKADAAVDLKKEYEIVWAGDFENQERASKRLETVVPVSLLIIFLILFVMFGNIKDASLVLVNVPFAIIGGIFALLITGINFSISAGIGFIALFGICIQNGVILISVFKKNIQQIKKSDLTRGSLEKAIKDGLRTRVRPVIMTALMAAIGLLPAALSTDIGSETAKPLAIVVIGGLITATFLTLLAFPLFFYAAYRKIHVQIVEE